MISSLKNKNVTKVLSPLRHFLIILILVVLIVPAKSHAQNFYFHDANLGDRMTLRFFSGGCFNRGQIQNLYFQRITEIDYLFQAIYIDLNSVDYKFIGPAYSVVYKRMIISKKEIRVIDEMIGALKNQKDITGNCGGSTSIEDFTFHHYCGSEVISDACTGIVCSTVSQKKKQAFFRTLDSLKKISQYQSYN